MTYYPVILLDTSILVAYYDATDEYHSQVRDFFVTCTTELITTVGCVTEVMWLLAADWQLQNNFLSALAHNIYQCEQLLPQYHVRTPYLSDNPTN